MKEKEINYKGGGLLLQPQAVGGGVAERCSGSSCHICGR